MQSYQRTLELLGAADNTRAIVLSLTSQMSLCCTLPIPREGVTKTAQSEAENRCRQSQVLNQAMSGKDLKSGKLENGDEAQRLS